MEAPSDSTNRLDRLIQLAEEAVVAFNRESGGCSACSLQKMGRATTRLRYLEGRAVVAARMLQLVRKRSTTARLLSEVDFIMAENQLISDGVCGSMPDWAAYLKGAEELLIAVRRLLA